MASAPAFQAGDDGSIPFTRSKKMSKEVFPSFSQKAIVLILVISTIPTKLNDKFIDQHYIYYTFVIILALYLVISVGESIGPKNQMRVGSMIGIGIGLVIGLAALLTSYFYLTSSQPQLSEFSIGFISFLAMLIVFLTSIFITGA